MSTHIKRNSINSTIRVVIIFILFASINVNAGDKPEILVINSDASIEKYTIVQEEFRKEIPYPISSIQLNDKKWDIASIESLFLDKHPALIYCIGTKAYLIANKYAKDSPVIFSSIMNWLRLPITPKTYGISNELHAEMQLMIARYIFPNIRKIGILYSKEYNGEWFLKASEEAKKINIEIIGKVLTDASQTSSALKSIIPAIDTFWLISDPLVMSEKEMLFDLLKICDERKIPVFSYNDLFAQYGAVLIISADDSTIGRQAAGIASELLSKRKPNENIQYPAGSRIILNLKKTKVFGLKYSEEALSAVNEIIE